MTELDLATAMLVEFEGCSLTAEWDVNGWEIGYGDHQLADGSPVTRDCTTTQPAAVAGLAVKVGRLAALVVGMLTVAATAEQTAALISFAYNVGTGALRGSTLLRLFNAGDVAGAGAQFPAWIHAGGQENEGLVKRRAAERAVFLGDASHFQPET
jgi:lysozyme